MIKLAKLIKKYVQSKNKENKGIPLVEVDEKGIAKKDGEVNDKEEEVLNDSAKTIITLLV